MTTYQRKKKCGNKALLVMLFQCLLIQYASGQTSFILAGVSDTTTVFTDIFPDSVFLSQTANHTPYIGGELKIDLNKDGILDVKLASWGNGGLGGGAGGVAVFALDSDVAIVSHSDTSAGCCPGTFITEVADTLNLNDTINLQRRYGPGGGFAYLMNETYGGATGPNIHSWNNAGHKFIGIRLFTSCDTLFAWIKVAVNQSFTYSLCTFSVFEYACGKSLRIGIDTVETKKMVTVCPQPASDRFRLEFDTPLSSSASIKLYDLNGEEMISKGGNEVAGEGSIVMDAAGLPGGNYILLVKDGKQRIVRHITIAH